MNPENYKIMEESVGHKPGYFVPTIEFMVCKRCGLLVGDADIHDNDHESRDRVAKTAFDAHSRSYDYTPYGR